MRSFGSLGKKIRSGKGCSRVPCDPRGISRERHRSNFPHPDFVITLCNPIQN